MIVSKTNTPHTHTTHTLNTHRNGNEYGRKFKIENKKNHIKNFWHLCTRGKKNKYK